MARRKLKAGSQSVTVPLFVQDNTASDGSGLGSLAYNTSGLAAKYRREGEATWATISLVTATVGTYTSGGFVADGGPVTGGYEFGVPNAVLASGAKWAEVAIYGAANMLPVLLEFELDAVDYQDAAAFGLSRLDQNVSAVEDAVGDLNNLSEPQVLAQVTAALNTADVATEQTLVALPATLLDTALGAHDPGTVGEALVAARAQGYGRWVIDEEANTLTLYDTDDTTALRVFDLAPSGGPYTSRTPQ